MKYQKNHDCGKSDGCFTRIVNIYIARKEVDLAKDFIERIKND